MFNPFLYRYSAYLIRISVLLLMVISIPVFAAAEIIKSEPTQDDITEVFLQHVGKTIGDRYELDETSVNALRQSIRESIETILKQDRKLRAYVTEKPEKNICIVLLELLSSNPDIKVAFAEHLTETQFQNYVDFTKARRQRYSQASVQFMLYHLTQALSLTSEQHQNIKQLLLDRNGREPHLSVMNILLQPLQQSVVSLLHDKDKVDGILTRSQSKVWHSLVTHYTRERKLTGKLELQEWINQLAEYVLAAHIEQLAPLDANASKRLALASKGVLEQFIESQNGEIAEMLNSMRIVSNIVNYPLFQQTIKNVLSEGAFSRYEVDQVQRKVSSQLALHDITLALIDTLLLLDDTQRKRLKMEVALLSIFSSTRLVTPDADYFLHFLRKIDRGENKILNLSPWQSNTISIFLFSFESEHFNWSRQDEVYY